MAAAAVCVIPDGKARFSAPRPASRGCGDSASSASDSCKLCNGRGEVSGRCEVAPGAIRPKLALCDCVLKRRGWQYADFHRETLVMQGKAASYSWRQPSFTSGPSARLASWSMQREEWLADFDRIRKANTSKDAQLVWNELVKPDWKDGGLMRLAAARGISPNHAWRLVSSAVIQTTRAVMAPRWKMYPIGVYFKPERRGETRSAFSIRLGSARAVGGVSVDGDR